MNAGWFREKDDKINEKFSSAVLKLSCDWNRLLKNVLSVFFWDYYFHQQTERERLQ